jgi:HD-like signal output (HDOD) protein
MMTKPERKRILFVDDEEHVLAGLENLLRRQRREWDMAFALGGEAALRELRRQPFDVVVSDMRMPGMDGADLLKRVQVEYPGTARLVLSGHADRDAVMRALPVAHQFLSKPCDADVLRAAIERTCALQTLLHNGTLRAVVGTLDKLPSVSESYLALMRTCIDPDGQPEAVAAIVERDPAMSAKVLQLVNSGCFGFGERIASVHRAVLYLGLELIHTLAASAQVFAPVTMAPQSGFSLDALQDHSVLTARLAKRLVQDPQRADEAFAAAILHDIGKIVLAVGMPDALAQILELARQTGRGIHTVEQDVLGVTHAEIGGYLLGVWGVPFSIVESVAYHHRLAVTSEAGRDVAVAVHVANALVHTMGPASTGRLDTDLLDLHFLNATGLSGDLPKWREIAARELRLYQAA